MFWKNQNLFRNLRRSIYQKTNILFRILGILPAEKSLKLVLCLWHHTYAYIGFYYFAKQACVAVCTQDNGLEGGEGVSCLQKQERPCPGMQGRSL
jgi:hypothetical protein